jgi:tetratricopeptide (TPR) repeat protein
MPASAALRYEAQNESPAAGQLRRAREYRAAGRIGDAATAYRSGLAEIEAGSAASAEDAAKLHAGLGDLWIAASDLEQAAQQYSAALRLWPAFTSCWCNLATVYMKQGRPNDAITLYSHALSIDPAHWASRTNLAQALIEARQYAIARALLTELVAERPHVAQLYAQLGRLHHELDQPEPALEYFAQAVALNPADHESIRWIGGIRQNIGDLDAARATYTRAAEIQPFIHRPARIAPAAFSVLALYDPFAGNIPTEYFFRECGYDTNTLALLAGSAPGIELLRNGGDIVVNLISDADQASQSLPLASELAQRLGKPIINDPRKILRTTRESVALLLADIADCRVPKVVRHPAASALAASTVSLHWPIVARPAGTHGGDDMEKIDDAAGLAAFVAQHSGADQYLAEYVDYRSADGYFRKYRLIFVGGEILPYHLAIGSEWKVHHDSTDMDAHPWMQQEELAFLENPASVFGPRHYRALAEIQKRIDLEYFGIDCSLDNHGNLLVFEVNASMLVHDHNDDFPYKTPFVHRIKSAFDAMLTKIAAGAQS